MQTYLHHPYVSRRVIELQELANHPEYVSLQNVAYRRFLSAGNRFADRYDEHEHVVLRQAAVKQSVLYQLDFSVLNTVSR